MHIHRHDAHAFLYVLEGTIVEQVRGGKEVTLTPGQTFYEGPNDLHTVGRNASTTKRAKFVVVLLKKKGELCSFRRARVAPDRVHIEKSKVRRGLAEEEGRTLLF